MTDDTEARRAAVGALRSLAHALVASDADDATLSRVAAAARALVPPLDAAPRRERVVPLFGELPAGSPGASEARRHAMADRAVAGDLNPTGVDLEARREGDDAVADVVFGRAFEGAPGRVHGGMVAAVFDDVTGFVLAITGEPAFTGRLAVVYRAPVPVEAPVEFRARMRERRGRTMLVEAEARAGGAVVATAQATFVIVDQARFATHASRLEPREP